MYVEVVISPRTSTRPVVVAVSQATRASGSSRMIASRIASLIWSHILSGWPSVTDSDVKRYWASSTMLVMARTLAWGSPPSADALAAGSWGRSSGAAARAAEHAWSMHRIDGIAHEPLALDVEASRPSRCR